jgi:hypothetical protein
LAAQYAEGLSVALRRMEDGGMLELDVALHRRRPQRR